MIGQARQQEQANANRYASWLQGEHQKQMQVDQKNIQINERMQQSMVANSQIADYSLDQLVHNSGALKKSNDARQKATNIQARRAMATSEASSSSRGISTDSGTAKAIRRQEMQNTSEKLHALDMSLQDGQRQLHETRKQQLGSRDMSKYSPVNFTPSKAPVAQDNSFGILAGGLLGMAQPFANAGYFGATEAGG